MTPQADLRVVCRLSGGVLEEVARAFATECRHQGVATELLLGDAPAPPLGPDTVLVGRGPEFDDIVRTDSTGGDRSSRVLLWCLDPLPPPGLPASERQRQLALASTRASINDAPGLKGGLYRLMPRSAKKLARRVVVGRSPYREGTARSDVPGFDVQTFYRLSWITEHFERGQLRGVVGSNAAVVAVLAESGIPGWQIPPGYAESMGVDEHRERDIDLVFLGNVGAARGTRSSRLEWVTHALTERGLVVEVPTTPRFGPERAALLNRAKVSLNLRSNTWHPELLRFVLSSGCGAAFVSDLPGEDWEPLELGQHFVAASTEGLAQAIAELVEQPARREAFVARSTALLHGDLSMRETVSGFLGVLQAS